jgi:hypothetical protein
VAFSGLYGTGSDPEELRRFFARPLWGVWALPAVPVLGLAALAAQGRSVLQAWDLAALGIWLVATLLAWLVVLPAAGRIRSDGVPVPALSRAAAACDLCFVVALGLMIWQPS